MAKQRVFKSRDNKPGLAGSSLIRPSYNDTELKKAVDVEVSELIPQPKATDFNLVTLDEYNRLLNDFDNVILQFQNANILSEEFRLQVTDLQTQVEDLQKQLESAGKLSESLQKQIEDLTSRLNKAMSDFNSAIQRATQAESRNAELSGQVSALNSQIAALQSQINSLNSLISGGAAAGGGGGGGRTTPTPQPPRTTPTPTTTPRPPGTTPTPSTPTPTATPATEEQIKQEEARRDRDTPGWRVPIEAEIKRARDYWATLPKDPQVHAKELFRIVQIDLKTEGWQVIPTTETGAAVGWDPNRYRPDLNIPTPMMPDLSKFDIRNTSYENWGIRDGNYQPIRPALHNNYGVDALYEYLVDYESKNLFSAEGTSPLVLKKNNDWVRSRGSGNFSFSRNGVFGDILSWLGINQFRTKSASSGVDCENILLYPAGEGISHCRNEYNPSKRKPFTKGSDYNYINHRGVLMGLDIRRWNEKTNESDNSAYLPGNEFQYGYRCVVKRTIYDGDGINMGNPIDTQTFELNNDTFTHGNAFAWQAFAYRLEKNVKFEITIEKAKTFNVNITVKGADTIVPLLPAIRLPGDYAGRLGEADQGGIRTDIDARQGPQVFFSYNDPYNPQTKPIRQGDYVERNWKKVPNGTKYTIKVPAWSYLFWSGAEGSYTGDRTAGLDKGGSEFTQIPNKKVRVTMNGKILNRVKRWGKVLEIRCPFCAPAIIGHYKFDKPFETSLIDQVYTNEIDDRPDGWQSSYIGIESATAYENRNDALAKKGRRPTAGEIEEWQDGGYEYLPWQGGDPCCKGYFEVDENGNWGRLPSDYPPPPPYNRYVFIDSDIDLVIEYVDEYIPETGAPNQTLPWDITFTSPEIDITEDIYNEDPGLRGLPSEDQLFSYYAYRTYGRLRPYKLYPNDAKINLSLEKLLSKVDKQSIRKLNIILSGGADLNIKYALRFTGDYRLDNRPSENIVENILKWGPDTNDNQNTNFDKSFQANTDWTVMGQVIVDSSYSRRPENNPDTIKNTYTIDPSKWFGQFNQGEMIRLFLTLEYANYDGSSSFEILPLLFGRAGTGTSTNPLIRVTDLDGSKQTILNTQVIDSVGSYRDFKIITQKSETRWNIIKGANPWDPNNIPDWITFTNLTDTESFGTISGVSAGQGTKDIRMNIAPYISTLPSAPQKRSAQIWVQDAIAGPNYTANPNQGTNYAIIRVEQTKSTSTSAPLLIMKPPQPITITAAGTGNTPRTFEIDTNTNDLQWSVLSSQDWIVVNPPNGTGKGTTSVSITPNSAAQRLGQLKLEAKNYSGVPIQYIDITQLATNQTSLNQLQFRNVTTQDISNLTSQGRTLELDVLVEQNVQWNLVSTENWILFNNNQTLAGTGPSNNIQVRILPNSNSSIRSTSIFLEGVIGINVESIITLTQLGVTGTGTGGGNNNTPSYMEFITEPAVGQPSSTLLSAQPKLQLKRADGTVVTTDNTTQVEVKLSKYETPLGGTSVLNGTKVVRAVNGIVTFTDLTLIGDPGSVNTLTFTATNIPQIDGKTRLDRTLTLSSILSYQIKSSGLFGASTTFEWISPDGKRNIKTLFINDGTFNLTAKGDSVIIISGNGIIDPPSNGSGYTSHLQSAPIYEYGIYVPFGDTFELSYVDNTLTRRTLIKPPKQNETTTFIIQAVVDTIIVNLGEPRIEKLS